MFDERDLAEISSPDFPGERLIVCRNPVLAEQRSRKRQELLAATEDKLAALVKATGRAKEPLRGAAEIGVRVGKVINQHKVGKHFLTTIADDSFSFARDLEKIAAEEELDGLYIVRSNVEPQLFDADQTVQACSMMATMLDDEVLAERLPDPSLRCALAGAVLMDLALENRIDTDLKQLLLISSTRPRWGMT